MNEIKKLSNSLEKTLKDTNLQQISVDLTEFLSDSFLDSGLLKDIPIIGTLVGLTKATINLNQNLLLKKIIYFLTELKEIKSEKRKLLISEINNSKKYSIKVGEKLLYILDKCDDHITAKYIARLFNEFLKENINYSEFIRGSSIIQKILIIDFEHFLKNEFKDVIVKPDEHISDYENSLINSGLCYLSPDYLSVRDQDDWKMDEKYIVEGNGMNVVLTDIGQKIKKILK